MVHLTGANEMAMGPNFRLLHREVARNMIRTLKSIYPKYSHRRINSVSGRRIDMAGESGRSTQEEARRLLGDCTLFRGLSADERTSLVARARISAFSAGDVIFLMGSPGDCMMAVLNGNVRISVPSPEGKEIVVAIMHPGDVFGEIALLDGKSRSADAKAMSACSLAILERRDVLAFLDRYPGTWPRIVQVLCQRLRLSTEQIAEVALMDLPARLAKTLLRLAAVDQDGQPAQPAHQVSLSQRELGNIVGATRESINKCLREWQHSGIVKMEDNLITIRNRPVLKKLAEID